MTKSAVDFKDIIQELNLAGLSPELLRSPKQGASFPGVVADSRKIAPGLIFCAIKGGSHDGHEFLTSTVARISVAIIENRDLNLDAIRADAVVRVASTRAAWAQLQSMFCGHPSNNLKIIGITGTNGKTSSSWMVGSIFKALSKRWAVIGTLGILTDGTKIETGHTTPDPDVLYPKLKELLESGVEYVAMEVSSHALAQGKVWPIRFAAAGFTSFSQDHLDFHKTMDAYLDAKLTLFKKFLRPNAPALFHESLLQWPKIVATIKTSQNFLIYGSSSSELDYAMTYSVHRRIGRSEVELSSSEDLGRFDIPMIGDVFAQNFALAVIIVCKLSELPIKALAASITKSYLEPVPGRLEIVRGDDRPWRPLVFIDYAHTPDALEKALNNLRDPAGRLAVVFGCGGDRDKSKRPVMGKIAKDLADAVFITSDNPRTEEPKSIIDDIVAGVASTTTPTSGVKKGPQVIMDRKEAIGRAISSSFGGDTVLVAGKGHEDYQIIGTKKLPFSDQAVALESLKTPRSWLVFGAGVSGFAAAEHLIHFGDRVTISDDKISDVPEALRNKVQVRQLSDLAWSDFSAAVCSPGVPLDHHVYKKAAQLGLLVISEIDLGLDGYPGRILGVTGTNGKSTTVAMTEYVGRSLNLSIRACGNIGLPPSALNLRRASQSDSVVIELSSYQLEGSRSWLSEAVAFTSFSSDHLARHKTMENYFSAKWKITKWLKPGGTLLLSGEVAKFALSQPIDWPDGRIIIVGSDSSAIKIPSRCEWIELRDGRTTIGGKTFDLGEFGLVGSHNHLNAIFSSIMLQSLFNVAPRDSFHALMSFRGLPYRCQTVFDSSELKIINDSKSTNLESTLSALSMMSRPAILIMGGQGKGESYTPIASARSKIQTLITFGASGETIAAQAPQGLKCDVFKKMMDATLHALRLARDNKWDILFSPGCASFDEFKNFEDRGATFSRIVHDELDKS
jgi:UDP-N-acetylmuramoyl-L-alanyl-D-glutamate--2,6-diaminopimelate ligase